ncbi:hypothetical protein N7G274_003539 [Stereocaulon virgatum]|uniref:Uncharacterized protein n=1 Tax=Stereocaulon virgatum TaxID=373712 RepID=A0ABR4AKQ6_9LECA
MPRTLLVLQPVKTQKETPIMPPLKLRQSPTVHLIRIALQDMMNILARLLGNRPAQNSSAPPSLLPILKSSKPTLPTIEKGTNSHIANKPLHIPPNPHPWPPTLPTHRPRQMNPLQMRREQKRTLIYHTKRDWIVDNGKVVAETSDESAVGGVKDRVLEDDGA